MKIQFGLPTNLLHCVATITQSLEYVLMMIVATVGVLKAATTGKVVIVRKNYVTVSAR